MGHLSGQGRRDQYQDAEIREVRGIQAHAAQVLCRRGVVARRRRDRARHLVSTSAKRLLSDADSSVSE